jgi:hypothetical protein
MGTRTGDLPACSTVPHGPDRLHNFLNHLNSLTPCIHFIMEIESNNAIPFLDVLVIRKETKLATRFHRIPTHTGRYLSFKFNHPPHVKRGLIQSLHKRASTICQERKICAMRLVAWDVIFSSVVIPKVSSTQLLIPRVAVVRIRKKSLWAICISHMLKVFQRSSNA